MAFTWLKGKYARPKPAGTYRSSHNDSTKRRNHKKATDKERQEIQARQPKVTLVVSATGKRRFVKEYVK